MIAFLICEPPSDSVTPSFEISIFSSNVNSSGLFATFGDTIYLTMIASESIYAPEDIRLDGKVATVLPLSIGNNANASLEVTNSFQATVRLVSISITNVYDLAGNVVPLISNTTDGSTVTLGERYRRPIYRP